MKIQNKKAFTLIEFVITITIMGMVMVGVYAPYNLYQTKQKVRSSIKILTQTLYESRSLAINGLVDDPSTNSNVSVGVHMEEGKEIIEVYGYPKSGGPRYLMRSVPLIGGVALDGIGNAADTEALFLYSAITGEGKYYYNGSATALLSSVKEIPLGVNYKGSTTDFFKRNVTYYTKTFISDY